jgi:hypothetical protein
VTDAGVVEPRGERPVGQRLRRDRTVRGLVTNVLGVPDHRADLLGGPPGSLTVDVGEHHGVPAADQPLRDAAADAAGATGDDGGPGRSGGGGREVHEGTQPDTPIRTDV